MQGLAANLAPPTDYRKSPFPGRGVPGLLPLCARTSSPKQGFSFMQSGGSRECIVAVPSYTPVNFAGRRTRPFRQGWQHVVALPPPRKSTHPVDVGLRTEAHILSELVRRGYSVLLPFGVNRRYDLVLDLEGAFLRVQCKTGRLRNGAITFSPKSVQANTRRVLVRDYRGEADVFLVYCPDTEGLYAVPVEEAGVSAVSLRVAPTQNGQETGVRWAAEYELPG